METPYRKVQIEINCQDHDQTWLIGKSANFIFNPNTRNGEELFDFLSCCEEIPDNSHQLEKLESEKKELLEALEEAKQFLNYVQAPGTPAIRLRMEIESLIQKHKQ